MFDEMDDYYEDNDAMDELAVDGIPDTACFLVLNKHHRLLLLLSLVIKGKGVHRCAIIINQVMWYGIHLIIEDERCQQRRHQTFSSIYYWNDAVLVALELVRVGRAEAGQQQQQGWRRQRQGGGEQGEAAVQRRDPGHAGAGADVAVAAADPAADDVLLSEREL